MHRKYLNRIKQNTDAVENVRDQAYSRFDGIEESSKGLLNDLINLVSGLQSQS